MRVLKGPTNGEQVEIPQSMIHHFTLCVGEVEVIITRLEATVDPGGSVRDNRFDLEEFFFAVVTANDGETQSAV